MNLDCWRVIIEYLDENTRNKIKKISKELCELEKETSIYYVVTFKEDNMDMINNKFKNIHIDWVYNLSKLHTYKHIKRITFGHDFNQKIENLPNTITHLTFGFHFNQKIENLPNSLTHLTINKRYLLRHDRKDIVVPHKCRIIVVD